MPQPKTELLIDIVGEAMSLPLPQRESFVRGACAEPEAQREALSLLAALQRAGSFLDRPTVTTADPASAIVHERPGSVIGRYRLVEKLGEGGFGVVFSAQQTEPVRRTVAIKVIKLGMDTAAVVARFEAERQTLALMDHPCIAKVLDAGATETGRPYFVMELVRGYPITRYCESRSLSARDRLALFIQVCRAVQHAHTKGIIHRDLKPANVLVSDVDGEPLPRIIDFGIAKATAADGRNAFTEARQFVGTPEYMSPEQAQVPGADLDTRTDIYSLGVLLYELLTGATPIDGKQLRSAAWDQMLRMIRELDPPRPSTRTLADPHPPAPASSLRGDLDWIVMRCLEKDRARRYQTADGLAADIQRHLTGEPVLAAPPSRAYRARKFIRRHRAGVAASAVALAALIAGLAVALWQAGVAAHERDEANARRKETEQVAEFQASQLRDIDPQLMGSRIREDLLRAAAAMPPGAEPFDPATLGGLLDRLNLTDVALRTLDRNVFSRAIEAIDAKFADQPRVRAGLLLTAAESMAALGLLDRAEPSMRQALDIRRSSLGPDDRATLRAACSTGALLVRRGKLTEADALLTDTLSRAERTLGPDDRTTIETLRSLSILRSSQDKLVEGERLARESLTRAQRSLGPDDSSTLRCAMNLGLCLLDLGKLPEAETQFRRAYDGFQRLRGPDDRDTVRALSSLADSLRQQDKFDAAEPLLKEALQAMRRRAGERHPSTLGAMHSLAMLWLWRNGPGDAAQSAAMFEQVVHGRRAVLGPTHTDTIGALFALGDSQRAAGQLTKAEATFRETLSILDTAKLGSGPQAVMSRLELGRTLTALGNCPEAETQLLQVSALMAGHGGTGPGQDPSSEYLADLYTAWDKAEPGKGYDTKAAQWRAKVHPTPPSPDHPQ